MATNQSNTTKEKKEDTEIDKKASENIDKKESTERDVQPLNQILAFINADDWQDIISLLDPSRLVLPKENYELINARIAVKEYNILHNIYEHLSNLSTNVCNQDRLIQLFIISKLGAILLQFKQNRLAVLQSMLQIQANMYTTVVNALASVASLIPSVSFNPIANIKWSTIVGALLTALALIGTEIGNIKNNIRNLIRDNEFCIKSCLCNEIIPLGMDSNIELKHDEINNMIKTLTAMVNKELKEFLEGKYDKLIMQDTDKAKQNK
jgi:isoleucyl-tRNA synthetase